MDAAALYRQYAGEAGFDLDALRSVMQTLGTPRDDADLAQLLTHLDADGDGVVSEADFCASMASFGGGLQLGDDHARADDNDTYAAGGNPASAGNNNAGRGFASGAGFGIDIDEDGEGDDEEDDDAWRCAPDTENALNDSEDIPGLPTDAAHELFAFGQLHGVAGSGIRSLGKIMCRHIENATKAAHEAEEDARRHLDRLTQLNESLTDECQRVETELAEANAMQRKSQTSINEVARLTALNATLEEDISRACDQEKEYQTRIAELDVMLEELRHQLDMQRQETTAQKDIVRSLQANRDMQDLELKQLEEERRRATEESTAMAHALQRAQVSADSAVAGSAEQEQYLRLLSAKIHHLEEELAMKDAQIDNMRVELQEQGAALMTALNADAGEASKGSVLNEIEDLVMSQLKEEHGDIESTKHMTVSLLQRLLPRIEETNLSNHAASRSSSMDATAAVAERIANAVLQKRRAAEGQSPARSLAQDLASEDTVGDEEKSETDGNDRADGADASDLSTRAEDAEHGAGSPEAASPPSSLSTPSAAPQCTPTIAQSPTAETLLSPLVPTNEVATEPSSKADEALSAEELLNERLEQVLRLYAASTQHLAGIKIVTRETAEQMDVGSLKRLRRTLLDLVAARNKLLVRTLGEREGLRNDIHLKKAVLKPVITFLRQNSPTRMHAAVRNASANGSPSRNGQQWETPLRSAATGRGMQTPAGGKGGGNTGQTTPTNTASTGKRLLSSIRFWSPPNGSSPPQKSSGANAKSPPGSFSRRLGTELSV